MLLGTAGGEDWYLILLLSLYSNPLALRALPLYFAAQNTEEEGEMYSPFASASILYREMPNRARELKQRNPIFNPLPLP